MGGLSCAFSLLLATRIRLATSPVPARCHRTSAGLPRVWPADAEGVTGPRRRKQPLLDDPFVAWVAWVFYVKT